MISHLNLQQLEDALALKKHDASAYQNNLNTAPSDQKPYWVNHLEHANKAIKEYEDMVKVRKSESYFDILIKDLYKNDWQQIIYGGNIKTPFYDGDVIGVEIEYEGENLNVSPALYWKQNSEHSLRQYKGHDPIEYALIKPLLRPELDKALDFLDKKMKTSKSNPVISPRTSVHIHLNAQDLNWKQVVTWFVTYALVEDILVEYSGKERIGNLFCLRARDTQYFLNCLERAVRTDQYSLVTNSEYRYTSMNLASIVKFGSVEFRSMRSPISFTEMGKWIDVLVAIKKSSLQWKTPNQVVEYFEAYGAKQTLKRIFPTPWMFDLFSHPDLTDIMWSAIREVKDVAYASNWKQKQPNNQKPKEDASEEYQVAFNPENYTSFFDDNEEEV